MSYGLTKACSLEIWLEPNLSNSSGTVLAFYWPASKVVSFSLRQWRDGLVLELQSHRHATEASIYVGMFSAVPAQSFSRSARVKQVRPSMWMARWSGTFQTSN